MNILFKGEWLHSSGKTRCFLPGSHLQLCSFLSIECPLVSIEMPIVGGGDEERLKKVFFKLFFWVLFFKLKSLNFFLPPLHIFIPFDFSR